MAEDSQEYPPSDYKLSQLRELGEFPRSNMSSTLGLILGLLLFYSLVLSYFSVEISRFAEECFAASSETSDQRLRNNFFSIAALSLSMFAILSSLLVVLINFIQNKFFFSLSLVDLDFSRLNGFGDARFREAVRGLWRAIFMSLLVVLLGYLSLLYVGEEVGLLFLLEPATLLVEAPTTLNEVLSSFLLASVLLILILTLVSFYVQRYFFLRDHRMSRNELEAESREQEVSPEMKSYIEEQHSE